MEKVSELRERYQTRGSGSLSDAGVIALILGVSGNHDTIRKVSDMNLQALASLSVIELQDQIGLTNSQATVLHAAFEIGRRKDVELSREKGKIGSSKDAYDQIGPMLEDLAYEEFHVLYMNRKNVVIHRHKFGEGSEVGSIVPVQRVIREGLLRKAQGMILVHNHPSGYAVPSDADGRITEKIKDCAKLMDMVVLDHIIVGSNGKFYSFADEGRI
jgi:DNA repair protein RadC